MSDVYIGGTRVNLGNQIGKGGEGEIYLLNGSAKKAVKIYRDQRDVSREQKVRAMVRLGMSGTTNLVSFPEDIATDLKGEFIGFTMRLVDGYRPIHELYGVKSRKINYPKADFRFLIRAAANTARAVAKVHQSPCVIGDLNHSGILVGGDMTVALIDADSFQLQANGRIFPCLVGVPDFTPPELHGIDLKSVTRTKFHDQFGLAVVIFQLLFMGRHPYSGRQHGTDFPLEKLIAQNRFAYSRNRNVGVSPPPGVTTLSDFPSYVSEGFERAFGPNPTDRPTASDWVGLLDTLEKELSRCRSNPQHLYPTASKGCAWCGMESALGIALFVPTAAQTTAFSVDISNFDVERVLQAIRALPSYSVNSLQPKVPVLPSSPSSEALSTNQSRTGKIVATIVAIASLALLLAAPQAFVLSIIGAGFAWLIFKNKKLTDPSWAARYAEVDTRWDEMVTRWRGGLKIPEIEKLRQDLETTAAEYKKLPNERSASITALANERRNRQLYDFLDHFLIKNATINGIGASKAVTLASFGIETAADLTYQAITAISGFGPVTANRLLAWRAQLERRFVYNPAVTQADQRAQDQLEVTYSTKRNALATRLTDGLRELQALSANVAMQLNSVDPTVAEVAIKRAQLAADLSYLGVSKPLKSSSTRPPTARFSPSSTSPTAILNCPNCGAPMLRRTARKGTWRGRAFWGCSRYPVCKGTRN
jgi:DNA-binding helix-hairpin-helix protein with protein kinase domain